MTSPVVAVDLDGPVATVTLDRPEALNAITNGMLGELQAVLGDIAEDGDIAVVVLTGRGRAFSAGVDLKALGHRPLAGGAVGDVLDVPARAVTHLLATMAKPVIAKVNGFCFTGALELALACDIVVVADDAVLGDTHAKFGLRPSWGLSQRLPRAVGASRARLLSYTAATFTGLEAAAWGLAVQAVPRTELDVVVQAMATAIAGNSRGAVAAYKSLYAEPGLAEGLEVEALAVFDITDTEERVAGFR